MEDLIPIVSLGSNHLYYEKMYGENIFNYFYKQECSLTLASGIITVIHPQPFLRWGSISTAEKISANLLINKYFNLKSEAEAVITSFYKKHFSRKKILGVHYRGRDKINETPIVQFDEYIKKIDLILKSKVCNRVFFSTDELELRKIIRDRYKDMVVLYPLEGNYKNIINENKSGIHYTTVSPYLHAKDALYECYLLSLSTILMSSHKSSMSLFVTFFNPQLPHIIIEP